MFDKSLIAKKLTELRQKKQKTQQEVASALGLSVSAIAMYEAGVRVPRERSDVSDNPGESDVRGCHRHDDSLNH